MWIRAFVIFLLAFVGSTASAFAEDAITTSSSWLRTGPDYNFPLIERVPRGSLVDVVGCTEGYDWCDIEYDGERGWFLGSRLQFVYQGRRGSLRQLAPLLGLMILQFSFGDYWNEHYRERPWFNDRNRQIWQNWQPQGRTFQYRSQPYSGQAAPVAPVPVAPVPLAPTPLSPQIRQAPLAPQAAPLAPQPREQVAPHAPTPQENFRRAPHMPAIIPPAGTPQLQHPAPKKPCVPPDVCR